MKTGNLIGGLCVTLVLVMTTNAVAIDASSPKLLEALVSLDRTDLTGKRTRNLDKAIDRLTNRGDDIEDEIQAYERAAKPLARALGGTDHERDVENAIIGILIGLRSRVEDIADDIEDRSEGEMRDEFPDGFPDGPPRMVLSDKSRRKVAKLLSRARELINGRGDDWSLGKKGKALKRRAKDLSEALAKLGKAERKLVNAGL